MKPLRLSEVASLDHVHESIIDTARKLKLGYLLPDSLKAAGALDDRDLAAHVDMLDKSDPHHWGVRLPGKDRRRPGPLASQTRHLLRAVSAGSTEAVPDVYGFFPKEDRETFAHDLFARTAQRVIAHSIAPRLGEALSCNIFAYRTGYGRFEGLWWLRTLAREQGFVWARGEDIAQYFPSISVDQAVETLEQFVPLDDELRTALHLLLRPNIIRDPDRPDVAAGETPQWEPPTGKLLQGSVLAPMLSNAFSAVHVVGPFEEAMGDRVLLLIFADDMLLLARSLADLHHAFDVLAGLIAGRSLHLPLRKSTGSVDLRKECIPWLGKNASSKGVETPLERVEEAAKKIATAKPGEWLFMAKSYMPELLLDDGARVQDFYDLLGVELGADAQDLVAELRRWWHSHRSPRMEHLRAKARRKADPRSRTN